MTANPLSLIADPQDDGIAEFPLAPRLVNPTDVGTQHAAKPLPGLAETRTRPAAGPSTVAGPSARLVALPQLDNGQFTTPEGVDDHLSLLEEARQAQLDALPPIPRDVVAAAHRGTVTRILQQVRAARQRLREGLYGICTGCGTWIHPERLELRPWLITCTGCASPDRP